MRDAIRAEFSAIEPYDQMEREHLADALDWIDSGAQLCRLFKPSIPKKHLVSYFVVVDESYVLLVDHKNAQLWLPTGGHVEPGEHPRATVIRELREELGIITANEVPAPFMATCTETVGLTAGHTDVSLWYVVHASREQLLSFDQQEFNSVRWFKFNEVPFERSDPHMKRFVGKLYSNPTTQRAT